MKKRSSRVNPHSHTSLLLFVSVLLTACGGGGSDSTVEPSGGSPGAGSDPVPTGDANDEQTIGSLTEPLSALAFDNQFSAPRDRQAVTSETIAYVRSDAAGVSLRLIEADGNGDRTLFTAAPDTYIGDLFWRPDNTEIAFESNFEVSVSAIDIYATTIDGSNIRRLTSVPRPVAYPNFPQGEAVLTARHASNRGGTTIAYIEGSQQAYSWLATAQEFRSVTFTVADFGDGVAQTAVVNSNTSSSSPNTPICNFDPASDVDIEPGSRKTITQRLPEAFATGVDFACPTSLFPQWGLDGTDSIVYLRQTASSAEINYFNNFSLIRSPTENLAPRQPVTILADFNAPSDPGFIRNGTQMQLVLRVNPTANTNQFMLVSKKNSQSFTAFDEIAVASFDSPSDLVTLPVCSGLDCDIIDAEFVSGRAQIVYTITLPDGSTQLRLYSSENDVFTDSALVELSDEVLGGIAVSPDGQTLMVERRSAPSSTTDLWRYEFATSSFTPFIRDAIRPAWSR